MPELHFIIRDSEAKKILQIFSRVCVYILFYTVFSLKVCSIHFLHHRHFLPSIGCVSICFLEQTMGLKGRDPIVSKQDVQFYLNQITNHFFIVTSSQHMCLGE